MTTLPDSGGTGPVAAPRGPGGGAVVAALVHLVGIAAGVAMGVAVLGALDLPDVSTPEGAPTAVDPEGQEAQEREACVEAVDAADLPEELASGTREGCAEAGLPIPSSICNQVASRIYEPGPERGEAAAACARLQP